MAGVVGPPVAGDGLGRAPAHVRLSEGDGRGAIAKARPASSSVGLIATEALERLVAVLSVSTENNLDVSEEAVDFSEAEAALQEQHVQEEFAYLRTAGDGHGAYEIWSQADAAQLMHQDPDAMKLSTRWVHTGEKSRLVTRDYNKGDARGEYFAATGNPLADRVIPTIAVKRGLCTMTFDAMRAYLQVMEEKRNVFVTPPKEWKLQDDYVAGALWKARTIWYGERAASMEWQEFLASKLVALGGLRGQRDPTKFFFTGRKIYVETHADDGHAAGDEEDLCWLYDGLTEQGVQLKPRTIHHVGETYTYKRRTYRREAQGMFIGTSSAYIANTLKDLDMDPDTTKPASTPMASKPIITDGTGDELLPPGQKAIYGRCVMRGLYMALDGRYDMAFPIRHLSRHLQNPTKEDWAKLKRAARYLAGHQHYECLLPVEGALEICYADSDTDWAADTETRKSTSCGVLDVGGAVQGMYVRGQETIATSSGVAEFLGAGSVVNEGVGLVGIYAEMDIHLALVLRLDSTAAIGMVHRRGTGRVRHLDVRHLKLQEMIREGTLNGLEKLPTEFNRADLGTKVHDAKRMAFLMDLIGMFDCSAQHEVHSVSVKVSQASSSGLQANDGLINVVAALQRAVVALAQVVQRH